MKNILPILNDIKNSISSALVPIHREGNIFIGIFAVITLVFFAIWEPMGWVGAVLTSWCVYFFRDPIRYTPEKEGLVIATGDGVVQKIEQAKAPDEFSDEFGDSELTRVSIFLNVFNVHVNRVPIDGTITAAHYHAGEFFSANLDKASDENERQSIIVEAPASGKEKSGKKVIFVQIAGLIARRIVCDLAVGQDVKAGDRYGIIRFGSRCDIYLPKGVNPLVCVGQTTIGGETIIADIKSREKQRTSRFS